MIVLLAWTALAGKPVGSTGAVITADENGFGASVSEAGDVNGDGFGDVIVGAYRSSSASGAAFIFHGSKDGMSTEPAAKLTGTLSGDAFGFSVSAAGDVNGDGFDDVVVGCNPTQRGEIGLFLGAAEGVSTVAATTITATAAFGYSVTGAGDVDNDGYDDVLVGNWSANDNGGTVSLFRGSADGLTTTAQVLESPFAGSYFGWSIDGVGDFDGDGFDDVIVGAWAQATVHVFKGSSTGLSEDSKITFLGTDGSYFGQAVAGAGDVDGDGRPDIVIGAPGGASEPGQIFVYRGEVGATAPTDPWGTWSGALPEDKFGRAVAGAGDLDDDGFSDILVGAPGMAGERGSVFVFGGSDEGSPEEAAQELEGAVEGDRFGWSVSGAGDVDGNERADLLIGADGASEGAGNITVFLGSGCGCASSRGAPGLLGLLPLILMLRRRSG